jgi:O-methyltransferase
MAKSRTVDELISRYPLISEQVSRDQLRVILKELARTLEQGTDGDVVEFGCYIGTTSLFVRRLLNEVISDKAFHVYDSFEGLPPKTTQDASRAGEQFTAGQLAVSKKSFLREFQKAGLKPPIIHKGWFGKLTGTDIPNQIAFAFLDGDFYESIRDSLQLVLPRLSPGATIIIDDYVREALPGAAKAVAEFLPPDLKIRLSVSHNLAIIRT